MKTAKAYQVQRIETPIGAFRAVWSSSQLRSFEFLGGTDEESWTEGAELPSAAQALSRSVENYFQTGHFEWDLDQLDWSGVSPFHQRVLRACYLIPPAATQTYGELASRVGSPGASRAVGSAMARNRWPLLIPCHRIVGSSGKLVGYSGLGGIETKRKLLKLESDAVSFSHSHKT